MKQKFYRFMQGRYGADRLNYWILGLSCLLILLSYIVTRWLIIPGYLLCILCIYRMFSKNVYARYQENAKFNSHMHWFDVRKSLIQKRKNDPYNAYYLCPNCKQMVRVPKGRGFITITCPRCRNQFKRKS